MTMYGEEFVSGRKYAKYEARAVSGKAGAIYIMTDRIYIRGPEDIIKVDEYGTFEDAIYDFLKEAYKRGMFEFYIITGYGETWEVRILEIVSG